MHTFAVRVRSARSAIVEIGTLPARTRAGDIARLFAVRPGDTIRLRVLRGGAPTAVPLRIGRGGSCFVLR